MRVIQREVIPVVIFCFCDQSQLVFTYSIAKELAGCPFYMRYPGKAIYYAGLCRLAQGCLNNSTWKLRLYAVQRCDVLPHWRKLIRDSHKREVDRHDLLIAYTRAEQEVQCTQLIEPQPALWRIALDCSPVPFVSR